MSMFKTNKKKPIKTYQDYLGYCNDPDNKELKERESDEEQEYIYDYFPLMTRIAAPTVSTTEQLINSPKQLDAKNIDISLTTSNAVNTAFVNQPMDITNTLNETIAHSEERTKDVVKNGTTYENNSYNPVYKPKYLRDFLNKTTTSLADTTVAKLPEAKLHVNFHKPDSVKYENRLFMNALSVLVIITKILNFKN